MQLAVSLEIVTQNFQLAVDLFAETILVEAKACQGSNQLLLRRVVIDYPLRRAQRTSFCLLSLGIPHLYTQVLTLITNVRIPHWASVRMPMTSEAKNRPLFLPTYVAQLLVYSVAVSDAFFELRCRAFPQEDKTSL